MWKASNRTCGRTARWLGEYLDGTLPLARRRAVEAHLRACSGCRSEAEAMRRTLALLAGLPRRVLSEDFDTALQTRLEEIRSAGPQPSGIGRLTALLRQPDTRAAGDPDTRHPGRYLRAPWPSPFRRWAPAGAVAALALGVATLRLQSVAPPAQPPPPPSAPAYVQAMVDEHQRLRTTSDLNATVVSHNLGSDVLGEGDGE